VGEDAEPRAVVHAGQDLHPVADPDVSIPWSRLEYGHWRRECVCSAEGWDEPAPKRVRLDPYDPATSRHLPQCEFASTTDPAILRALLKLTPKDGYTWVECGGCQAGRQVADLAEERAGRVGDTFPGLSGERGGTSARRSTWHSLRGEGWPAGGCWAGGSETSGRSPLGDPKSEIESNRRGQSAGPMRRGLPWRGGGMDCSGSRPRPYFYRSVG
jgi:hypothetical protein